MKQTYAIIIVLLLSLGCSSTKQKPQELTAQQRENKLKESLRPLVIKIREVVQHKKIALPAIYKEGENKEIQASAYLVRSLTEEFVKAYMTVMERRDLENILTEQRLQMEELFDTSQQQKIGKLLGIDVLLIGHIKNFSLAEYSVEIKAVDIATGKILVIENVVIDRQYLPAQYGGK